MLCVCACACVCVCVCVCVQVYYLRAVNEVGRQRWVTALTLAKAKAIKNLESGIYSIGTYVYMSQQNI